MSNSHPELRGLYAIIKIGTRYVMQDKTNVFVLRVNTGRMNKKYNMFLLRVNAGQVSVKE